MAFTRSLTFKIDDGPEIGLTLGYTGDINALGSIDLDVTRDPTAIVSTPLTKMQWSINQDARALLLDIGPILHDPTVQCIAQCLGIAVGKALIECLWRSRKLKDIEDCLKEKAIGALLDGAECVAKCLGVIA